MSFITTVFIASVTTVLADWQTVGMGTSTTLIWCVTVALLASVPPEARQWFRTGRTVGDDWAIQLTIRSADQPNDDRWHQQLDLIKSTGAEFDDESRSWCLPLDGPLLTDEGLRPLWRAALEYGTSVSVKRVRPFESS